MSEKLCTVLLRRELLSGRNAGRKNSTPEDSRLCFMPSAARCLAAMRRVAVYIISRPTVSVCAIRSSTPEACVLLPAWSRPDARLPLARASNAPVCTGPFEAPMPSSLSAVQNSVVVFKTSGSADQNPGPHDPSLSWRAPLTHRRISDNYANCWVISAGKTASAPRVWRCLGHADLASGRRLAGPNNSQLGRLFSTVTANTLPEKLIIRPLRVQIDSNSGDFQCGEYFVLS